MAAEQVNATNVTKYDAGGGDNYIADGYIKCVEKIWADSYTFAVLLTNTTITIARIPSNKKIMGIEVMINTTVSQTHGTISLGHQGVATAFMPAYVVSHNLTTTVLSLVANGVETAATAGTQQQRNYGAWQMVTSGTTGNITINLNNWTMTIGTIKTLVRYT